MFNIPGYSAIHLNRKNKIGGGICLFIHENLNYVCKNEWSFVNVGNNLESVFIEITNKKSKNIIVGVIYRPPNNKYTDFELDLNYMYILSKNR